MSTASELESAMLEAFKRLGMGRSISSSSSRGYGKATDTDSSDDVAKQTKKVTKALGSTAEGFDKLSKMVKDQRGKLMDAGNTVKEYKEVLGQTTRLIKKHAGLQDKMNDAAEQWRGSTVAFATYLEKHSKVAKNFSSALGQSTANAAMFGSAMIASHKQVEEGTDKYFRMMNGLAAAVAPLNKGILRSAEAWDDTTNSLKENLGPEAFARVRNALGAMEATIADSMAGLNVGSLKEMVDRAGAGLEKVFTSGPNSGKIKTAMLDLAVKMEAMGADLDINHGGKKHSLTDSSGNINMNVFNLLKNDAALLADVTRKMNAVSNEAAESIGLLNKEALKAGTVLNSWTDSIANSMPTIDNLKRGLDHLATSSVIAANFDKAKSALGQLYNQIVDFNVAMTPDTYWGVQEASLRMGMSFEETVKYMQENKRMLAIYGDGFTAYNSQLEGTFQKFGFNMEQASALIAPLTENAMASGVNVRDADAMNSYISQSMEAYKKMAAVTNVTADQFFSLNQQLLSSADMQHQLIGMDVERAQAYAADTQALQRHYAAVFNSAEAATEYLLIQRRQAREGVVQRMGGAARAALLARQSGMSGEDSQRIFALGRKGRRSTEEETELQSLMTKLYGAEATARTAAYDRGGGAGDLHDTFVTSMRDGMGGLSEMMDASGRASVVERAGAGVTAAEQARAAALAAGNESLAAMGNVVNTVTSLMSNALVGAVTSSALALAGLTWQAVRAAMALRGMGGGGLGGFGGGGRRGRFGKMARRAANPGRTRAAMARRDRMTAGRSPSPVAASARATGGGWGGVARGASRRIPVVGTLLGGAMLASEFSDINAATAAGDMSELEAARAKGGAVGGIAGGALGGAAVGAIAGSVVPVVGTVIGGVVGGVVGAIAGSSLGENIAGAWAGDAASQEGLIDQLSYANPLLMGANFLRKRMNANAAVGGMGGGGGTGSIMGGPGAAVPPSVTGISAAIEPVAGAGAGGVNSAAAAEGVSSVLNVQDVGAHTHLATIASKLTEAIELLQIMAEGGSPEAQAALRAAARRTGSTQIPSAWAHVSGRQPR